MEKLVKRHHATLTPQVWVSVPENLFNVQGVRFRHYKGGMYTGICNCSREADGVPMVTYVGVDCKAHTRPYHEFFEPVEVRLGTKVGLRPRFLPLDEMGHAFRFDSGVRDYDPEVYPAMLW